MRNTAAHHTGIRLYCDNFRNSRPLEDPVIGMIERIIAAVQILLRGMEGIGIFHGKFPDTDQAGPWTGLVTEFGLDLIDHKRIFGVGLAIFSYQLDRGFLVGHTQDHLVAVPVFKAEKFLTNTFKTAGFFPEAAGKGNREEYFLSSDGIHFFPDDLLDLSGDPLHRGIQRIDAICHIFDIAAPDGKGMAVDHAVSRALLKTVSNKISKFHNDLLFICLFCG